MTSKAILGISPGTRCAGIAVMKDGELIDWKTRTFTGTFSKAKIEHIVRIIQEEMASYGIEFIAIKSIHEPTKTDGLVHLTSRILESAVRAGIEVRMYGLEQLKKMCVIEGRVSKKTLRGYMAERHTALAKELGKENHNHQGYYEKLFEAVAVVHFCYLELAGFNF